MRRVVGNNRKLIVEQEPVLYRVGICELEPRYRLYMTWTTRVNEYE